MPIDFAAIAEQFRAPLTAQTQPLIPVFERLVKAVEKLGERAELAERATRAYPVLRFRGDALSVRVDLGSMPPFSIGPETGFVDSLRNGGVRFLHGIGWVRTSVQQEWALPTILGVFREAIQSIRESLDRFDRPTAGMFDPRARRFSDVFGLTNLLYRSLLTSQDQLVDVARSVKGALPASKAAEGNGAASAKKADAGLGDMGDLPAAIENVGLLTMSLVIALPVTSELISVLLHDEVVVAKRAFLTRMTAVEATAFDLRATVLDRIVWFTTLGGQMAGWLWAAKLIGLFNIEILTRIVPLLLEFFLDGVKGFAAGVSDWGKWITGMLSGITSLIDGFLNIDLMPYIAALIPGGILASLVVPTFTIDDLISSATGMGAVAARQAMLSFFGSLDIALYLAGQHTLRRQMQALAAAMYITITPRPFRLDPDIPPPKGSLAGFPDIGEAFFGGGRDATFLKALDDMGVGVRAGVTGVMGAASTLLTDMGTTFATASEQAAVLGSPAAMRRMAESSAADAEQVFGAERSFVAGQIAGRKPDPIASAFESALASGGFQLIGSAIPAYIGELRTFWAKRAPVARRTSPHILARHGRLGVVRVPRVKVTAPGRTPDADLAELVAARFRTTVADAYREGRAEFLRAAAAPGTAVRPSPHRPGGPRARAVPKGGGAHGR